jgi:hypothetical protein
VNTTYQIQLLTLSTGGRVLRLEDEASGLSLERKLDPQQPLVAQKERIGLFFDAMLAVWRLSARNSAAPSPTA